MTSIVSLSAILEMFKDEISVFKKGEKSVDSGHVNKLQFDRTLGVLRGDVFASMKNKKYSVEIQISDDIIGERSCSCPRGNFQCHHMAALLLMAHKNLSKTDTICSWKAPTTAKQELENLSIEKLYPAKAFKALNRTVSSEDKSYLYEELKKLNRFSGFFWILQEEPTGIANTWKTFQELVVVFPQKQPLLENLKVTHEEIAGIAEATVGQRDNPLWHQMRFGRLTASNFGKVISAIQRNRYPASLFSSLLGKNNLDGVRSIQWGISNEEKAIKCFEGACKKVVSKTGLWLHPSGIFGASPDGLVDSDAIVEVKCPYKLRNAPATAVIGEKDYCFNSDGLIKTSHPYYHQIQGQLHILNKSKCYFVIWTLEDCLIVEIEKDPMWHTNFEKMTKFYCDLYVDKLLN